MGQSPPGTSYNSESRGIMFYQGRAEFGKYFPTPNLYTDQPKRMAKNGDVLLSVRAPVGDANVALNNCCIGRGLAAIHSDVYPSYLYHLILSLKSDFDQYNGTGTVFGSINKDALSSIPVRILSKKNLSECNNRLQAIDQMLRTKHIEIEKLKEIRQALLRELFKFSDCC